MFLKIAVAYFAFCFALFCILFVSFAIFVEHKRRADPQWAAEWDKNIAVKREAERAVKREAERQEAEARLKLEAKQLGEQSQQEIRQQMLFRAVDLCRDRVQREIAPLVPNFDLFNKRIWDADGQVTLVWGFDLMSGNIHRVAHCKVDATGIMIRSFEIDNL